MKKLILFCLLFISINVKAMDKNELYDVFTNKNKTDKIKYYR